MSEFLKKQSAPAALRNRGPIADVLADELPDSGTVLEIASGTGEHAMSFAERFSRLTWQPSDPDPVARASIAAWQAESGLGNLRVPLPLDASGAEWPLTRAEAIVCINMVHISPWTATLGLFAGAERLLPEGAPLILYGPYVEDDVETAPSNLDFDRSLKARNPAWGLRHLARLDDVADQQGFGRTRRVAMPANNLVLVYRRTG
ncbi:DUF938 domain-containing protein [Altericroceibacterium xinjiangense]|uniref:DUF938 domain-containing protein n=1 Tax=Altericroceibacterium xinjiangense TaxID=762261 RepID=UPI000F7F1D8B|nr:DUF938 domain-containing protein [Altericroceibacterium xinjiangense]